MDALLNLPRFSFTRAAVACAPISPGVYAIFEKAELIYIGSTAGEPERSIRACLARHLEDGSGSCTAKATRYTWEVSISSAARVADLLAQFGTRHQGPPRCNQPATWCAARTLKPPKRAAPSTRA